MSFRDLQHQAASLRGLAICVISLTLLGLSAARAQTSSKFESPPVRAAADVLPEEMVQGEHFRVVDEIGSYDSLNIYTVESDSGTHEAYGEMELRILLREIKATAELKKVSGAKAAAKAAGGAATKSVRAAGELGAHPVKAAKALPGGVRRRFKSWGRTSKEVSSFILKKNRDDSDKMSSGEMAKGAARFYLGVDKAERKWAEKVGADPYTSFAPLKDELRRLGKYEAGAAKTVSFVGPKIHDSLDYVNMTYSLVWSTDPGELAALNKKRLAELGASPELIEAFFKVEPLSPSYRTFLISALMEMPEVEDRIVPIEQALTLQTQTDSLFHIECVTMASWFHTTRAPLERFVRGTMVPAGLTKDERLIVFSAADFAYWAEETAPAAAEFNEIYKPLAERREVWIAGRATPMFIDGVHALGWNVRTNLRQEILPSLPWGVE
jgi:hypothetical protein